MAKRPPGRPRIYDPQRHPLAAAGLARDGHDSDTIARLLNVNPSQIRAWAKKYPEFAAALKEGRIPADEQVASSLFRRALGYEYEETELRTDAAGKPIGVKKIRKSIAPDVTACIFWLKNRRPDLWRDVQERRLTGANGGPVQAQAVPGFDPSKLSLEQVDQLEKLLLLAAPAPTPASPPDTPPSVKAE